MSKSEYQRLAEDVDVEGLLSHTDNDGGPRRLEHHYHSSSFWQPRSVLTGLLIGIVSCFIALSLLERRHGSKPADTCTRKLESFSPVLSIFNDDDFHVERFDSRFYQHNTYRGPPSPEMDAAWEELTYPEGGLIRIADEDLRRINASEYAAQYTDELGGGYIGGIESLHLLHCVNMLRKATYLDYYLPKMDEWRAQPKTMRAHLDHCVDMLRQKLMCNPDVGLVTYVWAKGAKQIFPDFNTAHKCRDYSKVLQWARDNSVHGRDVSDIVRAPGAIEKDTLP